MKRRQLLQYGALGTIASVLPTSLYATDSRARWALVSSDLVYLSPVKANGELSSCQAEVWYVVDQSGDIYVCTATSSWRSQAIRKGLTATQAWIGDKGVWRSGDYQSLPQLRLTGSVTGDDADIETALELFGRKYSAEWDTWGPRFRNGLADGTRTMLRYDVS